MRNVTEPVQAEVHLIAEAVICAKGRYSRRLGRKSLKGKYRGNAQQIGYHNAAYAKMAEESKRLVAIVRFYVHTILP